MEIIPLSTYPPPPEGRTVSGESPWQEVRGADQAQTNQEAAQAQEAQPNETTQQIPEDESMGNNVDTFA
jgi:hypothetical protein